MYLIFMFILGIGQVLDLVVLYHCISFFMLFITFYLKQSKK